MILDILCKETRNSLPNGGFSLA